MGEVIDLGEALGLERDKLRVLNGETIEIRHVGELSFVDRAQFQRRLGKREALFRELGYLPPADVEVAPGAAPPSSVVDAMTRRVADASEEEVEKLARQVQELTRQIVDMICVGPVDLLGATGEAYAINLFLRRSRGIDAAMNRPAFDLLERGRSAPAKSEGS